jgi:multicomponent Na+:H+ antiporter subunit G
MSGLDLLAVALVCAGCAFFLTGTLGLLRFPDPRARLHALTKADNVGLGLICAGLGVLDASVAGALKLALVWVLGMLASTLSAFLIARQETVRSGGQRR